MGGSKSEEKVIVSQTDVQAGDAIEILYMTSTGDEIVLKSNVYSILSDNKYSLGIPLYRGAFFPISVGSRFPIFYNRRDMGKYSFKCLVVSREKEDNLPAFQILRISEVEKSQRRLYYRVNLFEDVEIKVAKAALTPGERARMDALRKKYDNRSGMIFEDDDKYELLKVECRDISGGGIRFVSRKKFEEETVVDGYIPLENDCLPFNARIVRVDKKEIPYEYYEMACQFEDMGESVRNRIISFVFKKQMSNRNK